jgi:hypothetical protein
VTEQLHRATGAHAISVMRTINHQSIFASFWLTGTLCRVAS